MRTFFVRYGTFFVHISTTPTATTITKLLLGPLSIARGQKQCVHKYNDTYEFDTDDFEFLIVRYTLVFKWAIVCFP